VCILVKAIVLHDTKVYIRWWYTLTPDLDLGLEYLHVEATLSTEYSGK
jgi:hypothetical protein